MYFEHFGLNIHPFKITPDPRLFFSGGRRGEILEALVYAITAGEGIIKVVGEVGSGKTMLCRMLEERLPDIVEIVYLANPSLSPEDILYAIALEMDIPVDNGAHRAQIMHALQQHLLAKHAEGRHVVVFVEEAQSMPLDTLEEVRLLSNLETQRDKLLQIVLFGQPELNANLANPGIRQLRERITHGFHLAPLDHNEIREYIRFRLQTAGYRGPDVFSASANRLLAKASEGLIRRVNILADKSLLAGFAGNTHTVRPRHVKAAIDDSEFSFTTSARSWGVPKGAMAAGVLVVAGAVAWASLSPGPLVTANPAPIAAAISKPAAPEATTPTPVSEAVAQVAQAPESVKPAPRVDVAMKNEPETQAATLEAVVMQTVAAETVEAPPPEPQATPETLNAIAVAKAVESEAVQPESVQAETLQSPAIGQAAPEPAVVAMTLTQPRTLPEPQADAVEEMVSLAPVAPVSSQFEAPPLTAVVESVSADTLLRDRMQAARSWIANVDQKNFSVQLLLTDMGQRENLEYFLRKWSEIGDIGSVYVYRTTINGRIWYGVLYGEFAGLAPAREALEQLPEEIRRNGPFIRNIRDIRVTG
ncbi:MAG: general secretion pathway protein [Gammaproteobacteria bacterium]|nr:MAG: general secretion pathway protein [Gammaproteobacteria bacterium]